MHRNKDKILVALDGSPKAFKTIEYLCNSTIFHNKKIVLYNVKASVPECYYDLKNKDFSGKIISEVKAWELSHIKRIKSFMEKSKRMLSASGFPSKNITIAIENRKTGIARDIIAKAQDGYYALLTRRRGAIASLLPMTLGSIATKLLEKAVNVPIILAGSQKVNNSVFIAVDGSEGSNRAVKFLMKTVGNTDCKIVLCSVLRDYEMEDDFEEKGAAIDFLDATFQEIDEIIEKIKNDLLAIGVKRDKIVIKIIQGVKSRAEAIVGAAKEEDCGTIVFGRKGRTSSSDFDIGRVPWKVINGAKKMTIWIIP